MHAKLLVHCLALTKCSVLLVIVIFICACVTNSMEITFLSGFSSREYTP